MMATSGERAIGERLRQQRVAAGLSQAEAAAALGISPQYLSNLETGQNLPNVWVLLVRIGDLLGVSTDFLLARTDNPAPLHLAFGVSDDEELWRVLVAAKQLPEDQRAAVTAMLRRHDAGALLGLLADKDVIELLSLLASFTPGQRAAVLAIVQQARSLAAPVTASESVTATDTAHVEVAPPAPTRQRAKRKPRQPRPIIHPPGKSGE